MTEQMWEGKGSVFKTKDTIFAILNSAKKNYEHMNVTLKKISK